MTLDDEPSKGTNAQEEKELRRVFDHLASFREKKKILVILNIYKERTVQLQQSLSLHHVSIPVIDKSGNRMSSMDIQAELTILSSDIEKKNIELHTLTTSGPKCITSGDLLDAMKALGKNCSKKEIQDMIWEGDEDLDEVISWTELKAMFNRNLMDKTNLEPMNFFNVIQFMTYDKKLCGTITADDTMAILFARYGKGQLESRMKMLFGSSDELTFVHYLERRGKIGRNMAKG